MRSVHMQGLWTTEENKSHKGEMNNDECSHAWTQDNQRKQIPQK